MNRLPCVQYPVSKVRPDWLMYVLNALPIRHEQEDRVSVLRNHILLEGPANHDLYVPRELRNATRQRIIVCHLNQRSVGFVSMPDWFMLHNSSLPFLEPRERKSTPQIPLLQWSFDLNVNIQKLQIFLVEQFNLILRVAEAESFKQQTPIVIRLWPLLSKRVVPEVHHCTVGLLYGIALATSLQLVANKTFLVRVELSDFLDIVVQEFFSMFQNIINQVPIVSLSTNLAQGPPGSTIDFVPSDSFCIPGSRANAMESTLCKNSNLHEVLNKGQVLHGIPGNLCEGLQTDTLPLHSFGWPALGTDKTVEGHAEEPVESSEYKLVSS